MQPPSLMHCQHARFHQGYLPKSLYRKSNIEVFHKITTCDWFIYCCMLLKYEIITHPYLRIHIFCELLESLLKMNSSGFSLIIDMTNDHSQYTILTCHLSCNQGCVLSKSSLCCNMLTIRGNCKNLA